MVHGTRALEGCAERALHIDRHHLASVLVIARDVRERGALLVGRGSDRGVGRGMQLQAVARIPAGCGAVLGAADGSPARPGVDVHALARAVLAVALGGARHGTHARTSR